MKKLEEIFTYENLKISMIDCVKGRMWKDSVVSFYQNYPDELYRLEKEIQNETYQTREDYVTFIHERGKVRKINSQHIRDRVVHKLLNNEVLKPTFYKKFIYHNYASQKRKGTDFAMKWFKIHLMRAYKKWGNDFYVLSIDMKKYFESIPHSYIEKLVREEIKDEKIIRLCLMTFEAYKEEHKGLGLGSEVNQTYALLCLNEFDHIIKERFKIKEYGRYMDDIYMFLDDKNKLNEILDFSKEYLRSIGLEMNMKKSHISPIKNGLTFLGFKWHLAETGHVIMRVKSPTLVRDKRKLRKYKKKIIENKMSYKDAYNCFVSMRGNVGRGNCRNVMHNFNSYYNNLFIYDRRKQNG